MSICPVESDLKAFEAEQVRNDLRDQRIEERAAEAIAEIRAMAASAHLVIAKKVEFYNRSRGQQRRYEKRVELRGEEDE